MSNKLLNAAINGLIERLDKTEKFVLTEAPELCKQIVREGYIDNGMMAIVSSIATVLLAALSLYFGLKANANFGDNGETAFRCLVSAGSGCGALIYIGEAYHSINLLLTVHFCPKLFLIRELRNLIK